MFDIEDLYQDVVIDHNRRPRNFRELENPNRKAEGFNPLCGDQVYLHLDIDDGDVVRDIGFTGAGCAISKASASMMTEAIMGKSVSEAEKIFNAFRHMLTRGPDQEFDYELLGDLEFLEGVAKYPVRIKCAVLSWHALNSALNGNQAGERTVSTE